MDTLRRSTTGMVMVCLINTLLAQSTTVQIGFLRPLNYPFVAANPEAAVQITKNLPPAIAYGLDVDASSVVFEELGEYDTSSTLGYITTLAYLSIPSSDVDALQLGLRNTNSLFYSNPVAIEAELVSEVNPAIAVYPIVTPTGIIAVS